jgi:hypothetical protein
MPTPFFLPYESLGSWDSINERKLKLVKLFCVRVVKQHLATKEEKRGRKRKKKKNSSFFKNGGKREKKFPALVGPHFAISQGQGA